MALQLGGDHVKAHITASYLLRCDDELATFSKRNMLMLQGGATMAF